MLAEVLPRPGSSLSMTQTESPRAVRCSATSAPVIPPPMMAASKEALSCRGLYHGGRAVRPQRERPLTSARDLFRGAEGRSAFCFETPAIIDARVKWSFRQLRLQFFLDEQFVDDRHDDQ